MTDQNGLSKTTPDMIATFRDRWRLYVENGRHRWRYLTKDEQKTAPLLSTAEKYFLGLPTIGPTLQADISASKAAEHCFKFFSHLQLGTGHWACEFTGTNVNIPGILIASYVTGLRFSSPEETEIVRYLFSLQNIDGGWGIHIAGESTIYGTALGYVILRLLGLPHHHDRLRAARSCLHSMGGVLYSPLIAKFWLAILGIVPWNAVSPIVPDIWLLPEWVPGAPWKWWVYPRAIHQAMGYIWSKKFSYAEAEKDPLIAELRQELVGTPETYHRIDWARYHNIVSQRDEYHTVSWVLSLIYFVLNVLYIPFLRTSVIRRRAEDEVYRLVQISDTNTEYSSIAAIAAPMAMLARYIGDEADSHAVRQHRDNFHDYLWMTPESMALNVTSGVQTWDTAFAVQAAVKAGLHTKQEYHSSMLAALRWLESAQMGPSVSEMKNGWATKATSAAAAYWCSRNGAWGFSEKAQGYPVLDCTGEALKAALLLQTSNNSDGHAMLPALISEERLKLAVDILLTAQDYTGGCSCYQPTRGGAWIECLNPSQIMDNLMVAYNYPECTGSCLTALHAFRLIYPTYRRQEIDRFIRKGIAYIHKTQRSDGSWKGSWGICFTYAAYFTLEALGCQGETYANSKSVQKACDFLIDKQNEDGGWSEHFQSSVTGVWHNHPDGSQVVQTAWALCALLEAEYPERIPLEQAASLLMRRQQPRGEYLQEDVEGAHQRSMVLKYPNYKFIFPIKALGMFAVRFESKESS